MEISMALFLRNRMASNRRKDAVFELMMKARAILRTDNETVVSVSEHDCGDPECGRARTVVLVMRADQPTEAVKLEKPIESVTQADLSVALAPLAERRHPTATHLTPAKPTRFDW
jgi:hypothetical protein